jgi:hypothetical protein
MPNQPLVSRSPAPAGACQAATGAPDPASPQAVRDHVHQDLLTIAYPAFRITRHDGTCRPSRWEAVRKNPVDPGLYAVITPDLDEIRAVLAATITVTTSAGLCRPGEPL